MTTNRITFAEFTGVLERLGFTMRRTEANGPKLVFHHAASDTLVVLPPLRARDRVPVGDLLSAQVVLPARGVTTEAHLEELLDGAVASRS